MAKIKLTKSAVDAALPQAQAVELRDTLVPGMGSTKGKTKGRGTTVHVKSVCT